MTYESMIDAMNESMQMELFDYDIETIGLTEGIDVKGKFNAVKEKVVSAITWIKNKAVDLWKRIKGKFSKKSKFRYYSKKCPPLTKDEQRRAAEKLRSVLKTADQNEVEGTKGKPRRASIIIEDCYIVFNYIDTANVNALLSKQTEYMNDAQKVSDYISNGKGRNALTMKNKIGKEIRDRYAKDNINLKVISDKTSKGEISQKTYDDLLKCAEDAITAIDKESDMLEKFNKVCNNATSKLNSLKQEDITKYEEDFTAFKQVSSELLGYIRSCFMSINTALQELSAYEIKLESVLTRFQKVISTYNVNVQQ